MESANKTRVFLAGDVVPQMARLDSYISKGDIIFSQMSPYIRKADIAIANLEAPVILGDKSPIMKSGPSLFTDEGTVFVLKSSGFTALTLANNHFFDQGQNGVEDTIKTCKKNDIDYVGGGRTKEEARCVLFKIIGSTRVAIINACENEFSIATDEHGGSNALDLISIQEDISTARNNADYVIVIIHGGVEHFQYPTPRMKRWYRHFVDLGVDAVINHHQHCMCGYEVYSGKPIFYGLGNFYFPLFDGAPYHATWAFGYALLLSLGETISFELIPYCQDESGIFLRDRYSFEKEMMALCSLITDDYLLQQKFDEFVISGEMNRKLELLPSFLRGRIFMALARRGFFGSLYNERQLLTIKNYLTCESHYESLRRLFELLSSIINK